MNKTQKKFISQFQRDHRHRAYVTDMFSNVGVPRLYVGRGVLRPDKSWVSFELTKFLARNSELYRDKHVLDMGCGSGVQGLTTCLHGARRVTAVDIEPAAVASTQRNITLNEVNSNMRVVKSDLFNNLHRGNRFELIIFNHPFFAHEPNSSVERIIFSGKDLLNQFFTEIANRNLRDALIVMPFSHLAGKHNYPVRYAKKYGYAHYEHILKNSAGKHSIVLMHKKRIRVDRATRLLNFSHV